MLRLPCTRVLQVLLSKGFLCTPHTHYPQLPAIPMKSCQMVTLSLMYAKLLTEMPILLLSMSQFCLTLHSPITPPDCKIHEVRQQVGHIAAWPFILPGFKSQLHLIASSILWHLRSSVSSSANRDNDSTYHPRMAVRSKWKNRRKEFNIIGKRFDKD